MVGLVALSVEIQKSVVTDAPVGAVERRPAPVSAAAPGTTSSTPGRVEPLVQRGDSNMASARLMLDLCTKCKN